MYVTIAYYEGFRNQYTAAEQHRENKPSAQINTNKYMGHEFIMLNNFYLSSLNISSFSSAMTAGHFMIHSLP